MNLRELEYLVALAEQRNFHRAAEVCNASQPTLSAQIRKLEEELGVTLFERSSRGLILTQAGEAAVRRARIILQEVTQLRDEAAGHC
ncbi:LysR family transcriptional regulator, partial [Salmonella enterica]|nr:LysR family transcriptional regulator [Salmonella enterica]